MRKDKQRLSYLEIKRNRRKEVIKKLHMKQNISPVCFSEELPQRNRDSVWVIGGGPSLVDFDFSLLEGQDTIAINKSILSLTHATVFLTMDYTFVHSEKYNKCDFNDVSQRSNNLVFILHQSEPDRVIYDDEWGTWKDSKFDYVYKDLHKFNYIYSAVKNIDENTGFGNSLKDFCHGNNSGFCGVQLALLMGYEKIYLLGFDLKTHGSKTHYHSGYGAYSKQIVNDAPGFAEIFKNALNKYNELDKIYSCSKISELNTIIEYIDPNEILNMKKEVGDLDDLMVVGYYTKNTMYETEAKKTIESCLKWNLNHDIVGVDDFGGWQANTRYKAKFMREMLDKHPDKRLLYVDCDAIIQQPPTLFKDYSCDIAVRWQDFRWRKNECLSGTIYMENNERTKELCDRWIETNVNDPDQVTNIEQWNLDKIITAMKPEGLRVQCLPPEYTFIFDHMKRIYPKSVPVIEHFQASRKTRRKG